MNSATTQKKLAIKKAKIQFKKSGNTQLGWSWSGIDYQTMDDYSVGMDYLKKYFENVYGTADGMATRTKYIEGLKAKLGPSIVNSQIRGLGSGIQLDSMSESKVRDASDNLASVSQGRIPSTISQFRQALVDRAVEVNWISWDALKTVSAGIASDVGDKVVKVGETILDVADSVGESVGFLANLNKYIPILLPVGLGVGAWFYFKGSDKFSKIKKAIAE
jgi:hypothetical protein